MLRPAPGALTLLLTDLQGSTRLWELYPDAMRAVLARHDALAAECVARHGGELIRSRGEGDSVFAVFMDPAAAAAAALDLQLALRREPWPPEIPVAARAAVHTGGPALAEGDYYGADANRAARLRAIAHGGQALLSGAAHSLARDRLPQGASLRDMGWHRLKDLLQPERVYQLLHPDLPADFPPLASLEALPNNLPRQLTPFVGRERELRQAAELLAGSRLLSIVGAGGCGKTRLALQAAAQALEQFPGGVWLAELDGLASGEEVPRAAAAALRLPGPGRDLGEAARERLAGQPALLLLDTCERLPDACARTAERLLATCPELRILATGRQPMGAAGEMVWRLPAPGLPEAGAPFARIRESEAVVLFCEMAAANQPAFRLVEENAAAVAAICRALDGLPAALALAAGRMRVLTAEQLAARLAAEPGACFRLLTGGSRTAPARHRSLRALLDWSHDLLSGSERAALRRLAALPGSWCAAQAAAAAAGPSDGDGITFESVPALLAALERRCLLEPAPGEPGRLRLGETVRRYAREQLEASGESDSVHARLRDAALENPREGACRPGA